MPFTGFDEFKVPFIEGMRQQETHRMDMDTSQAELAQQLMANEEFQATTQSRIDQKRADASIRTGEADDATLQDIVQAAGSLEQAYQEGGEEGFDKLLESESKSKEYNERFESTVYTFSDY